MIIGLLGLGTIGSGIYEHLQKRDDIRVKRILELIRHPGLEHLETSDYNEILSDPEIDIVCEDEDAETLGFYEVKVDPSRYDATRLEEKVKAFFAKNLDKQSLQYAMGLLSLDDM